MKYRIRSWLAATILVATMLAIVTSAHAQSLRAPDNIYLSTMFSDHGDGCKGCREIHPAARLQWDGGWGRDWADLTIGYFQNSVDVPSFYLGAALHRPIFGDSGLEAVMHVGLHTGYEHMTGLPISPLALPGIRYKRVTLMGAPLVEKGGNIEPFFVVNVDFLKF